MKPPGTLLSWLFIVFILAALPFATPPRYLNYVAGIMCFVAMYGALSVGMGVIMEQAPVSLRSLIPLCLP